MFPNVLKQVWTMDNSDLCVVGQHLGYNWNQVCEEVSRANFFALDGDGTFEVSRCEHPEFSTSKVINHIMAEIFSNNPLVKDIVICN